MAPTPIDSEAGVAEIVKSPACTEADAVPPVPPLVEVTGPVVLRIAPGEIAVTFTVMVQDALAATVPPLKLMDPLDGVAVRVPPHPFVAAGVAATSKPEGKVSATATPLNATPVFGLVMVKVRLVVPLTAIVAAPNALLMEGGATTVRLAEAVPPVPPCVEVTAEVVLFFTPAVVPVTLTENVHEALAERVEPDRLTVPPPALMVPAPQLPVSPLGVETTRPAGRVSLNPTPVSATALPFWMVKLRLVLPFRGILAAPKALVITGGPTTVMLAFAVFPVPAFVELTVTLLFFTPALVP